MLHVFFAVYIFILIDNDYKQNVRQTRPTYFNNCVLDKRIYSLEYSTNIFKLHQINKEQRRSARYSQSKISGPDAFNQDHSFIYHSKEDETLLKAKTTLKV